MSPIGSFEQAWENYDHTSGPALVAEAKEPIKVGSAAPNYRLVVGGTNLTRRLISCEATFSKEGESGLRFSVAMPLRALRYERARVSLWFGYGTKLVPFFRGRLADPVDGPSGLYSEATAYGLGTQMGQRYLRQRVNYGGWDLRDAWADLIARFGADPDRFYFAGTHSTTLSNDIGEFGLETSILEAEQTILEPMQFQPFDQIGGMRIVKRGHLADLGTDNFFSGAGTYAPEHYPKGGFSFSQSMRNFYSKVIVFRRTESYAGGGGPAGSTGPGGTNAGGEYAVYAESDVTSSGPFNVHEGRAYVVPDYPGSQEHAQREADLLANSLSRGVGRFEWSCPPIDFSLTDHFTVKTHEEVFTDDYLERLDYTSLGRIDEVSYGCVCEEMTLRIGALGESERFSMTVSGEAFEKGRTTIRAATTPVPITLGVPYEPPPSIDLPVDADAVKSGLDNVVAGANRVVR